MIKSFYDETSSLPVIESLNQSTIIYPINTREIDFRVLILDNVIENTQVLRAAISILSYLHEHPQAKDNITGIAQWWIGEELSIVGQAIILLMDEGVLEKKDNLYKLSINFKKQNKSNLANIIKKLQSRDKNYN